MRTAISRMMRQVSVRSVLNMQGSKLRPIKFVINRIIIYLLAHHYKNYVFKGAECLSDMVSMQGKIMSIENTQETNFKLRAVQEEK